MLTKIKITLIVTLLLVSNAGFSQRDSASKTSDSLHNNFFTSTNYKTKRRNYSPHNYYFNLGRIKRSNFYCPFS